MKKVRKIITNTILFVVAAFLCFLVYGISKGDVPSVFGYRVFRVVSQSMMPTIADDTCIIIKEVPEEELKKGDIITFISTDPSIYGFYNTHRIHEVTKNETTGKTEFVTKGDANKEPDHYVAEADHVVGRYVGELPFGVFLAKAINALSDQNIYFIFIIVPLLICLTSYVWQIIGTLTGRYDDEDDDEEDEEENER